MGRHSAIWPLFASAKTAAQLLDMTTAEFLQLVGDGALPGPVSFDRWDVVQIEAIMRGTKPKPTEDFVL